MPLTDTQIRNTKPAARPLKLFDGGRMFLLITPRGQRWWRLKYRYDGKEKLLSLSTYPEVSLRIVREKWDQCRKLRAAEIDLGAKRKTERAARAEAGANTFEVIAREWHSQRAKSIERSTLDGVMVRMEKHLFPRLRGRPISEFEAPELLRVLRQAEQQEPGETPRRLRQYCGQIFRYAIATGRATRVPAADLDGALKSHKAQHHATVTESKAVGALLRTIGGSQGSPFTKAALHLAPLVFVRPGELRRANWNEFDLAERVWRIPAARMKIREAHLVPLSMQAVAILKELEVFTGPDGYRAGRYRFPGLRTRQRPISEDTLNAALRRLGYASDEMHTHGFRSMASTLLNEQGWHRDAIERQLDHSERDGVGAAYNRAEHLPERIRMMQAWADFLDVLRDAADVVPLPLTV